jgi:hypothetical protein
MRISGAVLTAVAGLALAALVTTAPPAHADHGYSSVWSINRSGSYMRYRNDTVPSGDGLAPNNGPTEIGFLLINSRACGIEHNTVSSVNLGIFVRGGKSAGTRFLKNIIGGGPAAANNLLGICSNPAPGVADTAGPRGDSIHANHIARFGWAVAVSGGSSSNMFNGNTLASFTGAFREPENFVAQGGTNEEEGNVATIIPAENF